MWTVWNTTCPINIYIIVLDKHNSFIFYKRLEMVSFIYTGRRVEEATYRLAWSIIEIFLLGGVFIKRIVALGCLELL